MTTKTDEQIAAERAEMERIFRRPDGNALNTEAIALLIGWAEQDANMLARWRSLDTWGVWEQGTWGTVRVPAPSDLPTRVDEWDDTVLADPDAARDEVDQAVLNGACKSAYCMAGQAVTQAGYRLIFDEIDLEDHTLEGTAETCVRVVPTGERDNRGHMRYRDVGDVEPISERAADILGLDYEEQDLFFSGSNTVVDLKRYANGFCEDRHLPWMYPEVGLHG